MEIEIKYLQIYLKRIFRNCHNPVLTEYLCWYLDWKWYKSVEKSTHIHIFFLFHFFFNFLLLFYLFLLLLSRSSSSLSSGSRGSSTASEKSAHVLSFQSISKSSNKTGVNLNVIFTLALAAFNTFVKLSTEISCLLSLSNKTAYETHNWFFNPWGKSETGTLAIKIFYWFIIHKYIIQIRL